VLGHKSLLCGVDNILFLNQERLSEADIQIKAKIKIRKTETALLILDEKTLKI
jgi:hypothetical protein